MNQEADLKKKLNDDLKQAMKDGDTQKRSVLRMLLSSVHNAEISKQAALDNSDVLGIIAKEVKQHNESIEAFLLSPTPGLLVALGPPGVVAGLR